MLGRSLQEGRPVAREASPAGSRRVARRPYPESIVLAWWDQQGQPHTTGSCMPRSAVEEQLPRHASTTRVWEARFRRVCACQSRHSCRVPCCFRATSPGLGSVQSRGLLGHRPEGRALVGEGSCAREPGQPQSSTSTRSRGLTHLTSREHASTSIVDVDNHNAG